MARTRVSFSLRRAEVGQLFGVGGPVYIGVGRFADRVLVRARELAPERTGKLKRSLRKIVAVTPLGTSASVGSDLDYAMAVHEGTRRHVIEARGGGLLAFEVNGRKVFAKQVTHPGSKGNDFLRRALEQEQARGL